MAEPSLAEPSLEEASVDVAAVERPSVEGVVVEEVVSVISTAAVEVVEKRFHTSTQFVTFSFRSGNVCVCKLELAYEQVSF